MWRCGLQSFTAKNGDNREYSIKNSFLTTISPICGENRLLPPLYNIHTRFPQYWISLWIQRGRRHPLSAFCLKQKGVPAHASTPEIKTSSTWCCCPSLRWHYPDQVQPVGGDRIGHPLSLAFPSSPGEQDKRYTMKYNTQQSRMTTGLHYPKNSLE